MRATAAHLVRRHAGIGPAEHIEARHVEGAILANLRGEPAVPETAEEAAARFFCTALRTWLDGVKCAERHALATTPKGKGLGSGVPICGRCERCPAGAARARLTRCAT
jgi:hypothetical protein